MATWNIGRWDGCITGQAAIAKPMKQNTFIIWRQGELDDFELRLEELLSVERHRVPVVGALDCREAGKVPLVLDLDEVHPGGTEELEVFVYRYPAEVAGGAEVQEEGGGDVRVRLAGIQQAENQVAFVHEASLNLAERIPHSKDSSTRVQ